MGSIITIVCEHVQLISEEPALGSAATGIYLPVSSHSKQQKLRGSAAGAAKEANRSHTSSVADLTNTPS